MFTKRINPQLSERLAGILDAQRVDSCVDAFLTHERTPASEVVVP